MGFERKNFAFDKVSEIGRTYVTGATELTPIQQVVDIDLSSTSGAADYNVDLPRAELCPGAIVTLMVSAASTSAGAYVHATVRKWVGDAYTAVGHNHSGSTDYATSPLQLANDTLVVMSNGVDWIVLADYASTSS